MSEQAGNQDPVAANLDAIYEHADKQLSWISQAAEIIDGPGAKVEDVFDEPPVVRREAPMPDWTPKQEASVREISHKLGYGAEQNVPTGLNGGVRVLEGGLAWKIVAEKEALADEAAPGAIVFSGSPFRQITREDEQTFMAERQSFTLDPDTTEYDLATWFARKLVDEPAERTVSFGYEIAKGNPSVSEPTGQLINLGKTEAGQPVYIFRVDEEPYKDENGENKYRFKPNTSRIMGLVSEALETDSPGNHEPVGVMTSNAYAFRQVEAVSSGLEYDRQFGVAMYGRATLAAVKGTEVLPDVELNQIPGDLRVTHNNLLQLKDLVDARR